MTNSNEILVVRVAATGKLLRMSFCSDDSETVRLFVDNQFNRNVDLATAADAAKNWLADVEGGYFDLFSKNDEALKTLL